MRIILLGPPGAGKGTQAARLEKHFNVEHVSTGDLFRWNIKNETPLGKEVKAIISSGQLVPDELTINLVWDKLDRSTERDGFLLDGFPRTIKQAEALQNGLKDRGVQVDYAVSIAVDDEILVKRLSGRRVCPECGATYHIENNPAKVDGICDVCETPLIQREDDKEETVRERINVYNKQTAPLVDFYKKTNKLLEVDGTLPVDEVTKIIIEKLEN